MIRGVIFDMDGLMFDTERIWATLWKPALHSLGMEYKEGLAEAIRGTAGESGRRVLRQFYGADCDAEAIHAALHREADRAFAARPDKKPGLDEQAVFGQVVFCEADGHTQNAFAVFPNGVASCFHGRASRSLI